MAIGNEGYKSFTGEMPQRGGTRLNNSIELKKLRFERENGRKPTGAEVVAMMKESHQQVTADSKGADRIERAAEVKRNISSQPWSSELDEKEEMRSPAYLKEQSERRADERETDRINYARGLRKQFRQSGRREDSVNPLDKDEGAFQGFLNKYGTPGMRSNAEVERRLLDKQKVRRDKLRIAGENQSAMERGVDPRLAQEAERIERIKNLPSSRPDIFDRRRADSETWDDIDADEGSGLMAGLDKIDPSGPETHRKYEADSETWADLAEDEASGKTAKNDVILDQIDREYNKKYGTGEGDHRGRSLEELKSNVLGKLQNKKERIFHKAGLPAETGHMRNEILPGLHKKQYGKTKEDTEMSGLDRIAEQDQQLKDLASARPKMLEEGDERSMKSPLGNWKKDSETLDDEAQDQGSELQGITDQYPQFEGDERAARKAQEDMNNMKDDEKNKVVKVVQDTKGKQSEEAIAAKEATGDYVRYEGSGFVINKRSLDKAFDRQEKMAMLQHVPQGNRAAMLFNWGFIDKEDLDTAQKQSAKEIKEESLLDLRIAEVEQKMAKSSSTLSKSDQMQYTSHSAGFRQAVKDGDWETAQYFHGKMNNVLPAGSKQEVDFEGLMKKQTDKHNAQVPAKWFAELGMDDSKPYFSSVNMVTKLVNDIRKSPTKGNSFENMLSNSLPNGDTYGEFLKAQGVYSWKDIKAGKVTADQLSKMPGISEDDLISEEAYMGWALPKIQNKILTGMWGNVHERVQGFLAVERKKSINKNQKIMETPAEVDHGLQSAATKVNNQKWAKTQRRLKKQKLKDDLKDEGFTELEKGQGRPFNKKIKDSKKLQKRAVEKAKKEIAKLTKGTPLKGGITRKSEFKNEAALIRFYKDPKNKNKFNKLSASLKYYIDSK